MIKLVYVILKLLELLIFVVSGKSMAVAKSSKGYWTSASFAICAYALVEGLRYGRMVDYWGYLNLYNRSNTLFMNEVDPFFSVVLFFFKEIGLGLNLLLIIQSAILMYACFVMLQPYRKYAKYVVPLFLPLLIMNENFTRWFLACSFLYIAFDQYMKSKFLSAFIWILSAQFTHNAILPLIPVVMFYPLYNKILIPRSLVLGLFVFMTLFSDITNATFIVTVSDFLLDTGLIAGDTSMKAHLVHAEDLIQGDYLGLGVMQKTLYQKIINLIIWIPIVWFGYVYANNEKMKGMYNIMSVSIILLPLFTQVELLDRYTTFLNVLSVIIVGVYYYNELNNRVSYRFAVAFLSLMLSMYPAVSFIFNRGGSQDMLFIWDATNGF